MDDVTYIILVLAITLVPLFGFAYWLQRRSKPRGNTGSTEPTDPLAKAWSWYLRVLVAVLIVLVSATFIIIKNLLYLWIALAIVVFTVIAGKIYRIYRISKMK